MSLLRWRSVHCLPVVHGRLAFAVECRRRMLERRFAAVAVELPRSYADRVLSAVDDLPRITVIVHRPARRVVDGRAPCDYVPIQPADGIVEALRIARRERMPIQFVDAEVEEPDARPVVLPDPHALHTLGLEAYYDACAPIARALPRTELDAVRESHMAARLTEIARATAGEVLFVCGLAHWRGVRRHLERGDGERADGDLLPAESLRACAPRARSIPFLMGELPFVVARYERHRSGFELDDFDSVHAVKELLLAARDLHRRRDAGSLERPDPSRLRTLLTFARKLTVPRGRLIPDGYTLALAARGVVGNDFALATLAVAHLYPYADGFGEEPQEFESEVGDDTGDDAGDDWRDLVEEIFGSSSPHSFDFPELAPPPEVRAERALPRIEMNADRGVFDGEEIPLVNRVPGTAFTTGRLKLERPPDSRHRREYREHWDERVQCSWPPEDVVIESFRDYVGRRALSLARVGMARSEPFTTSFLDGIDLRETLRDILERRIHVREEPRVPGAVGALVLIFEEDDFGERFPWRTTWMAEHEEESTLAFYATDYRENLIGPGIARAHYGGCLLIFPPVVIPDIWDDLRFERARTPSERLLLAGIYWGRDHYLVHVGRRPPRAEVKEEAARRGRHILHLPLATFSATTLERLRRLHVLNGAQVRSWAHRFIR